jgi:DNA-binding response OmpR family regulator
MPKKVLIAEDDEEITELLKTTFETAGYAVTGTAYGGRLPDLIKKVCPDILILDVMLPGLDGYSLQLQLAQDEATRELPVIVTTALPATRALFEKFPQVKSFVDKPFDARELLDTVRGIIGA